MKKVLLNFNFRPVIIGRVTSKGLERGTTLARPGWKQHENSEKGGLVRLKRSEFKKGCVKGIPQKDTLDNLAYTCVLCTRSTAPA